MIRNHDYVEASYLVKNLKAQISRTVIDAVAVDALHHRLDNVQYFLDYLNSEPLGGEV